MPSTSAISGAQSGILSRAARDAFVKLDPRKLTGNPVILATEVVAALATPSMVAAIVAGRPFGFPLQLPLWLWATVLFANLAESVAEGRGKAAADSLRAARAGTKGKVWIDEAAGTVIPPPASSLAPGQVVLVDAGDMIPADGE